MEQNVKDTIGHFERGVKTISQYEGITLALHLQTASMQICHTLMPSPLM